MLLFFFQKFSVFHIIPNQNTITAINCNAVSNHCAQTCGITGIGLVAAFNISTNVYWHQDIGYKHYIETFSSRTHHLDFVYEL